MPKTLKLISIILFFFSLLPAAFSQTDSTDTIRIITYYPSPYGSYRELRSKRMAIGETYMKMSEVTWADEWSGASNQATNPTSNNASLVVEGNVGIGLTNPDDAVKLTVDGGAIMPLSVSGMPAIDGDNRVLVSILDKTPYAAGVGSGISLGGMINSTTTGWVAFGGIKAIKENDTYNDVAGALIFNSRSSGGGPTERMRITSMGNVGIGTTAPQASQDSRTIKLDVVENIKAKDVYLSNPKSGSPRWASESGVKVWDSGWVLLSGNARGTIHSFNHTLGAFPQFVNVYVSKSNNAAGGTMFQMEGYHSYGSGSSTASEVNYVSTTQIKVRFGKNDGSGMVVDSFDENKNTYQISNGSFYVRVIAMSVS